jgi:hypothetical protein
MTMSFDIILLDYMDDWLMFRAFDMSNRSIYT